MVEYYNPYNSKNRAFVQTDIHTILRKYNCPHEVQNIVDFQHAMVHSSYVKRTEYATPTGEVLTLAPCPSGIMDLFDHSYERLEHLGDSILGACVASYLFIRFPDQQEGFLTNLRKEIVCNSTLGVLAQHIGLDKFYVISRHNEGACNGRQNMNKLGDIMEAFIGALWKDCNMNFQIVYNFIVALIETHIDIPRLLIHNTNFKEQLQKFCQTRFKFTPTYVTLSASLNAYTMAVVDAKGSHLGIGSGSTKKQGEQNAAKCALEKFGVKI